eukprot:scaffold13054_cov19-Tisochrysis_lutea.AAC.3
MHVLGYWAEVLNGAYLLTTGLRCLMAASTLKTNWEKATASSVRWHHMKLQGMGGCKLSPKSCVCMCVCVCVCARVQKGCCAQGAQAPAHWHCSVGQLAFCFWQMAHRLRSTGTRQQEQMRTSTTRPDTVMTSAGELVGYQTTNDARLAYAKSPEDMHKKRPVTVPGDMRYSVSSCAESRTQLLGTCTRRDQE